MLNKLARDKRSSLSVQDFSEEEEAKYLKCLSLASFLPLASKAGAYLSVATYKTPLYLWALSLAPKF
jgi:hypothetical protein